MLRKSSFSREEGGGNFFRMKLTPFCMLWQRMVQFEGRGKRDEGSSLRCSVEHTLMYTGACQHRVRINKFGLHLGDAMGNPGKLPLT